MLAPRETRLIAQWRPLAALGDVADAWAALSERAAEPNVFYEPAFARAAAPLFGQDAGAILVRSPDQPDLLGLVPLQIARRRYGLPLPLLIGWTHPFGPLGVPLIDRAHVAQVVEAVLDHIAADPALPKILLLPFIPAAGPFAHALGHALGARGGRVAAFGRHSRALLVPGPDRVHDLDRILDRKQRKELTRKRRRLAETGVVHFELATAPATVEAALQAFFALEASGWKGRAGSAAAGQPGIRQFVEAAVTGLARDGKARAARLLLDDKPIAAGLTLTSGDGAWFWKIAYDESVARASPGVQLALDLTAALIADRRIARVDSCAAPDHPMIDRLWRDHLALADYLVCVGPQAPLAFSIARRLEALRRSAIAAARRARDLVHRVERARRMG